MTSVETSSPRLRITRVGSGFRAFECTIGVDSIDEIEPKIVPAGGVITQARMHIPTVGTLLYCNDTEGNRVGVMQYDR